MVVGCVPTYHTPAEASQSKSLSKCLGELRLKVIDREAV